MARPINNINDFIAALTISIGDTTMGRLPLRFLGPDGVELDLQLDSQIGWVSQHGAAPAGGSDHMLIHLTAAEDLQTLHEEFTRLASKIGADPLWWGTEVKLKYGSKYKVRAIRMGRPRNKIEMVSVRGRKTHVSVEFLMQRIGGVAPIRGRRRLDLGG